jgi:hypothetical protein
MNANNDPSRDNSWLADETAAAMRDFAGTVTEAPPLRLAAGFSPAGSRRRMRGARGWWTWLAPVTAAAVVVVLAIALVIVKDIPNGSPVPKKPATSTAGPGGVPRYYVALKHLAGDVNSGSQGNGIVVGDSLTGKTLAKFAPPAHTTFQSVTAAADDLTFVVFAITSANGSFSVPTTTESATMTGRWFEVQLAPGTAHPARLTPLPIKPQSWVFPPTVHDMFVTPKSAVFATALSGSGQELAVGETPVTTGGTGAEVKVFSLATGQLLHDWTTDDPSVTIPADWVWPNQAVSPLTWIDGDRTLALAMSREALPSGTVTGTVRGLNVAGPTSGDLMADSTVIWSGKLTPNDQYGCFAVQYWPPLISADAKTVSCTNYAITGISRQVIFDTDPLPAGTAAGLKPRSDYQVTMPVPAKPTILRTLGNAGVLWVSPSGDTLIGAWSFGSSTPDDASAQHVGVISDGKFTPLRIPASLVTSTDIAF